MAHPNEQHLRTASDALNTGDMATFLAAHTPDVAFHFQVSSSLAGDHTGRDGVGALFGNLIGMLDAHRAPTCTTAWRTTSTEC